MAPSSGEQMAAQTSRCQDTHESLTPLYKNDLIFNAPVMLRVKLTCFVSVCLCIGGQADKPGTHMHTTIRGHTCGVKLTMSTSKHINNHNCPQNLN